MVDLATFCYTALSKDMPLLASDWLRGRVNKSRPIKWLRKKISLKWKNSSTFFMTEGIIAIYANSNLANLCIIKN